MTFSCERIDSANPQDKSLFNSRPELDRLLGIQREGDRCGFTQTMWDPFAKQPLQYQWDNLKEVKKTKGAR